MSNSAAVSRSWRLMLIAVVLCAGMASLGRADAASAQTGFWADDYCYYEDDVQLGCLVSTESGVVYYYENATGLWYPTEEQGATADCSQNPIAVSCEELSRQADSQEYYWGTDSCAYNPDGTQRGCLYTDGETVYYQATGTGVWYLVEAQSDGSWTYTELTTSAETQQAETEALTQDEFAQQSIEAANGYWQMTFNQAGQEFGGAGVFFVQEPATSACKSGDPVDDLADWVFYCSTEQTIWFAPGVLRSIVDMGPIYVLLFFVGHEVGHHVQYWTDPESFNARYQADNVTYELQANCLSGQWFAYLESQDYLEADAVDEVARVVRTTFVDDGIHGTPDQQADYFLEGYQTGNC